MKTKQITTYEELLQAMGAKRPLRKKPVYDADKIPDYLTKSGNIAHSNLVSVIYGLSKIGLLDSKTTNNIVNHLDEFSHLEGF